MSDKHLTITIGSHFFTVTRLSDRGKEAALKFAKSYIHYGISRNPRDRKREPVAVFAAATKDREEFRFHINTLKKFKDLLQLEFIKDHLIDVVYKPIQEGKDVTIQIKPKWVLRDNQVPVVDYITNKEGPISCFVGIQTGNGKSQPLDSLIKIPGGWSTMGKMTIGTQVIAKDGTTTTVTGIYPQGELDIFKITFADGRTTECCGDHLWKITRVKGRNNQSTEVVNTNKILEYLNSKWLHNRVYIDLVDSEDIPDVKLDIDPYLLGVFLGDGSSRGNLSLNSCSPFICTPDEFIVEELLKIIPEDTRIVKRSKLNNKASNYFILGKIPGKNSFVRFLKDKGLFAKYSYEKFIPVEYLHASTKQRLHLLQGLMDTDGTIVKGGSSSYCTTSHKLALGVQYLVRSLGGIASIGTRYTQYTWLNEKKTGRLAYQVNIRYKKPSELFRLPKKKDRTNDDNQYAENLKLRVKSIEPIGRKQAQCISIAHPDKLYVTDDFIVTHNTFCSLKATSILGKRTVIIIRPMYIYKWVDDILSYTELTVDEIMVVQGTKELQALLMLAENGQLDSISVIIISNKTLQSYISKYELHRHGILDMGYVCIPEDMFELLEAGMRLIDEVHLDFHLNFKIDLYTNIKKSVSLSATLLNNNSFLETMYDVAYPLHQRYGSIGLDKYISARAIMYRLADSRRMRTSEYGSDSYSHNAFEVSIAKNYVAMSNYLKLMKVVIDAGFIKDYKPTEKLIIYCYRGDFCAKVVMYLKLVYPSLDIRRYISEDPPENMYEPDIRVTTLGSGSTAHDIKNLKVAILTVAVDSIQSNIQALGRLRKLETAQTRFYYYVCEDIPKHIQYHESKRKMLEQRAMSFDIIRAPFVI